MTDDVRFEVVDAIATITLHRPETLNAVSGAMLNDLGACYAECDADDAIRAVILTGAGRAFCAGADFTGGNQPFAAVDDNASIDGARRFESSPVRPRAWEVRKPVIAAINGHAIGIGMTLAMQCDFRVMASDAKWGIVQTRRGIVPDAQSHWTVPRAVGFARAAEILLAGRTFTGDEAFSMGVASRVVPSAEVLGVAKALAEDLRDNVAPLSYAESKRILWSDVVGAERVDQLERDAHLALMGHADAIEGPSAFMQKRAPQFVGRVSQEINPLT